MMDPERLISLYLNAELDEEQARALSEWIKADVENARQFVREAFIHRSIHDLLGGQDLQRRLLGEAGSVVKDWDSSDSQYEREFLRQLAESERRAEAVEVESFQEADEPVHPRLEAPPVAVSRAVSISRWSLATSLLSMAALLVIVTYLILVPVREPVAMLQDAMQAVWSSGNGPPVSGGVLRVGPMHLESGLATILFDSGAEVIIEGPAQFALESPERMSLQAGRVFARVPKYAIGFTIDTPGGRVVDLGTEFGLQVGANGASEVHMFEGKASLMAGPQGNRQASQIVEAGQAKRVQRGTGQVSDIEVDRRGFVRKMNSRMQLVWRGERLDLSDVIGGGNGFGTGERYIGIDPLTGEMGAVVQLDRNGGGFVAVESNRYIDGVFVPGAERPQTISTVGHAFAECPRTNGIFNSELANGMSVPDARGALGVEGLLFGTPERPCILMHANLGVTFDLQAMRGDLPGLDFDRFEARAAISDTATARPCNADFRVLVDGVVRYERTGIRHKGWAGDVSVPLYPQDRFLTLMTTDGGDPDGPMSPDRATDSDWCLFAEPVLYLCAGHGAISAAGGEGAKSGQLNEVTEP